MCTVACTQNAISLIRNEDGFYAPVVNIELCTDCGLCMKVCYQYLEHKVTFKNTFEDKSIYAAWSKNPDTVMTCSSGGAGYELTSYFYRKGYKICGVVFDVSNDNCKHIIAGTREDLEAIKTSKYLQSYTVDAFSQFKKGEKYLVVGTPCQIYGLQKWIQLKKWEDNFILIDFFCYGIPSFNLWLKYKEYLQRKFKIQNITRVNFRTKNRGWHFNGISLYDFSGTEYFQRANKDLFFLFFGNGSCLNESCYKCRVRDNYCDSDIRVADFWGEKYENNNKGVSMIIINTLKGKKVYNDIQDLLVSEKCNYADLLSQRNLFLSEQKRWGAIKLKRERTLISLAGELHLEDIYNQYHRQPFCCKMLQFVRRILVLIIKQIIGKSLLKKIKKIIIYGK
jgi:coenzyme F420-reducing hydrogenase beta subunit